jgi:putative transcriptional regulator
MNHPNRNPHAPSAVPKPAQVRTARLAAGMTPREAGDLVYERASRWLAFETGEARMHPAAWELFGLKVATVRLAPPGADKTPTPGETWYELDTGAAYQVDRIADGIVYAYGPRTFAQITLATWAQDFQRSPVAI